MSIKLYKYFYLIVRKNYSKPSMVILKGGKMSESQYREALLTVNNILNEKK